MFKDFGRRLERDLQRSLAARQVEHFYRRCTGRVVQMSTTA